MAKRTVRTVKDHYEALPYPHRDPADERKRLQQALGANLDGINHFVFGGKRDFSKPFRVLVAGGGTGDALIYLAQQLADRGCPSPVTYLDLSTASRAIAEERARIRKLDIRFHTGSLLDVRSMDLGEFDYIDCSGVLHHLPDPDAGLAALAGVLAPDGAMAIMLYGRTGRAGIYPMQEMLRTLAPASLPVEERLAITRRLLKALPPTNLLRRNPLFGSPDVDDAELFDLYLHSQDRAYSVPEIGRFLDGAGLRLTAFVPPAVYEPLAYCADPALLQAFSGLGLLERAAIAEEMGATISKHVFYCVRQANDVAPARLADAMVPVWHDGFSFPADEVGATYQFGKSRGAIVVQVTITPEVAAVARLIDGKRSLGEIKRACGLSPQGFQAGLAVLWRLHGLYYLFLRSGA